MSASNVQKGRFFLDILSKILQSYLTHWVWFCLGHEGDLTSEFLKKIQMAMSETTQDLEDENFVEFRRNFWMTMNGKKRSGVQ